MDTSRPIIKLAQHHQSEHKARHTVEFSKDTRTPPPHLNAADRGIVLGQVSSTTNHAGIVEFSGQWYIVYHNANAPGGGNFRRSVAVDRLYFNADGTIQPVTQTTTGPPPNPGGGGGGSGTNIAPAATVSTSHVSSWESLAAQGARRITCKIRSCGQSDLSLSVGVSSPTPRVGGG